MMGAVPEKSPSCLLLALLGDKPRPFIPSLVVWILWRLLQPSAMAVTAMTIAVLVTAGLVAAALV